MNQDITYNIGCILLGTSFAYAGIRNLVNANQIVAFLASRSVPVPKLALGSATGLQIIAGILLAARYFVPVTAVLLLFFVICATPVFHNFWDYPKGPERNAKINSWISNCAIIGGLLLLVN